jgi:xanthine dehydrogenase accessory factor
MAHWLDTLAGLGVPAVVVTVACAEGSTPREAGAKMIVTDDAVLGTIGGGNLEFKAIDLARALLARGDGTAPTMHRFALGPSLGQCCGGNAVIVLERFGAAVPEWVGEAATRRRAGEAFVLATAVGADVTHRLIGRRDAGCVAGIDGAPAWLRDPARALFETPQRGATVVPRGDGLVLLDRIAPVDFHVMLFGAGHVGQAIVALLGTLPCRVTWVDAREMQFPAVLPANVTVRWCDDPPAEVDTAEPGTAFLVMTHSHALDQDVCERILRRGDFAYLGLIGSATKRALFERRLGDRGIAREQLARLTCPIGIPGVRGKEPAVIAVAVAAQLLQVREQVAAAPSSPLARATAS